MPEIRWILLGIGLLLIGGIWWWGARRSGQAPGRPELRETGASAPPPPPPPASDSGEWGVPPFEPLSIKSSDFDRVPADYELPMSALAESPQESTARARAGLAHAGTEAANGAGAHEKPEFAASFDDATLEARSLSVPSASQAPAARPASSATASESQKIITIRVGAEGQLRWPGQRLMSALESQGLTYGRYQVFHRKHADGGTMFYVASLVEPGTFDITRMADQEFPGISAFAVLPGPADALQTLDALLATANELAQRLDGVVQDADGLPLSGERVAAMRENAAQFQTQPS